MNKRKYPYDVHMCPQLKIHVGDKQIANGVMGSEKMSVIYEKTKQILYSNAKTIYVTNQDTINHNKLPCDLKPSKQLQLTFDGKLIKSEILIKDSINENENQQKCSFCSKTNSLDTCGKCYDVYCNMCTFSLCSDEVNKICLTCYR
ncbi:apoptosis regulatory protein Siva-like [Daktulosphaira vitifoliae]|uniref:apoptosis regulatory protein Siva-like n=1 Tax=Daktulosphaira vitifoliae TaxID=58002 RepID=UPI0021AAA292|nr:apoptosis regulatory protein Siva-like [Daktulosphaira vitifoliae]XP_050545057.1 apoptosis regulatory protein Siva-like [Daktulosphaira vitifoliae]